MTSWNSYTENLLRRWSKRCHTYSLLHSLSADYFSTWNKRLGIPLVVLGGAASSSIFISPQDGTGIMNLVNGGVVLFMTALAGVSKFLSLEENQVKHQSAGFKYHATVMEIDTILTFPRLDRAMDAHEFVRLTKKNVLEIRENSPEILPWLKADMIRGYDESLTRAKVQVNKDTGTGERHERPAIPRAFGYGVASGETLYRSPDKTPPMSDDHSAASVEEIAIEVVPARAPGTWFSTSGSAGEDEHMFVDDKDPQIEQLCSTFCDTDSDDEETRNKNVKK